MQGTMQSILWRWMLCSAADARLHPDWLLACPGLQAEKHQSPCPGLLLADLTGILVQAALRMGRNDLFNEPYEEDPTLYGCKRYRSCRKDPAMTFVMTATRVLAAQRKKGSFCASGEPRQGGLCVT